LRTNMCSCWCNKANAHVKLWAHNAFDNHHEMQKFDLNKIIKNVPNIIIEKCHFATSPYD
jgi:hypothetical protein